MSKELTEKLENGKLERGYYYAKGCDYSDDDIYYFDEIIEVDDGLVSYSGKDVDEVLAPVPSYEELQKLKEQLLEANGIIKGASHLTVKDKRNAIICELISPEINEYLKKWGVK